jgi:cytochrome P450
VLNHADIATILQEPLLFSSSISAGFDAVLLGAEPEMHKRVRQVIAPFFSSRGVSILAQDIVAVTRQLTADIRAVRNFDFITDFAVPLPLIVMSKWLGIDSAHTADLRRWGRAVVSPETAPADLNECAIFCLELAADRLRAPGTDLLSQLLTALNQDMNLKIEEAASLTKLLLLAGTETTADLIGNAMLALLRHPEIMEQVRAQPSLIPFVIEETLRYDSPVQSIDRVTTQDVEISGVRIRKGASLVLCLGAANRDPECFPDPDSFVLMRRPRNDLAFGSGPHRCLGERLARLEAQIALETLLTHCPPLNAAQSLASLQYVSYGSIMIRGLEHLKLTWA